MKTAATPLETILEVSGISHAFGGVRAVSDVSFTVPRGRITSLIGPNGAGKTTIFNVISGFLKAQSGWISLDGRRIENWAPHRIALSGIGRTFQSPRVFAEMSVLENVVVGLRQKGERPLWALLRTPSVRTERTEINERAESMLAIVGLADRRHDMASTLSFGEQRFLSIARALIANPVLVLMDEPTVGLDHAALKNLLDIMARLVAERKTTLLLIEHHMETVMMASDKITLLVQGTVVGEGTPAEIKTNRAMIEAYLGQKYAS
jgi:branched-chain amino acid transport system ATP-binding protein